VGDRGAKGEKCPSNTFFYLRIDILATEFKGDKYKMG
jgi:hypothetical protein